MIKKHGSTYWLDIWVGKRRVRRSLKTDERDLAIERARDLTVELRAPKPKGVPFSEFRDRYLVWASQSKPASYSDEDRRSAIIRDWLAGQGISTLEQISAYIVEQLRAFLLARKVGESGRTVSRTTVNRYCALLRTMINKAKDWGEFRGDNPVSRIKFYREGRKARPLSDAEITKILAAVDDLAGRKHATPLQHEAPRIFRFILQTGLRRSEALNLKWTDIGDDSITVTGKGGKTRTIPLNAEARALLKRERRGPYVFNVEGRSSDSLFRRLTENISKKAGIPFHVHLLRHKFASNLLAAGVDIVTIGELLGHSAVMVTMLYAHSNPARHREAVERIQTQNMDTGRRIKKRK
jgi:integrase